MDQIIPLHTQSSALTLHAVDKVWYHHSISTSHADSNLPLKYNNGKLWFFVLSTLQSLYRLKKHYNLYMKHCAVVRTIEYTVHIIIPTCKDQNLICSPFTNCQPDIKKKYKSRYQHQKHHYTHNSGKHQKIHTQ